MGDAKQFNNFDSRVLTRNRYFTNDIAITPATTEIVPITLAKLNFSVSRRNTAARSMVQMGDVAAVISCKDDSFH